MINRNNNNNNYNSSNSKNNYFLNKNEKNKKIEKLFVLKENMFPEFNSKKQQKVHHDNDKDKDNFSNLFKKDLQELNENKNENQEKDKGWITIKKGVPYNPKNEKIEKEESEESEEPYKVFEKLTKLYENWKKNYIEQWGYDEYEKNYRFPNYDYSYLELEEDTEVFGF